MSGEFAGRVAVVTGGGSGIGREAAFVLARRGARVMVTDRDETSAAETAAEIVAAGGEAASMRVDVSVAEEPRAMVEATVARFGRLDFAVNSAGVGGVRARTADYPRDTWETVLAVNLTGVWLCMKHQIPAMLAGGGGSIVNVASVAGVLGFPHYAAYSASKHGVIGLTRSAALEYARKGLRVNAVCPAFTRTPMVDALVGGSAEMEQKLVEGMPGGRLGTPAEIAESIAYLCSDAAAFTNGHSLVLDGGLSIG
ncbi:MAG TPA: glucose 1-dehydrogenase [Longimicrobium sp.]|jgi:NAD(P)-dependent dehydrogenase (short-subunit alcohol dehydrogenase family)|uniref:glucose 1-dehydrogenase n=1 Tax=Longimicrobium sp. TaxID=2029185 RepID=UPI002EDA8F8B